jgi:c-di-GMP-binding flagellar brake protein YcgR
MDEQTPPQEPTLASKVGKPALGGAENGRRVERLPGAHLKLKLGTPLTLRLPLVEQRYEGKVVGVEPFEYIIVQARLPQDVLARLVANAVVVAQVHVGGTLYGFRSEVVNRVTHPAPLLILAYPATLERVVLRRNERVRVSVPGNVHGAFGDHEVVIVDLAPEGCCFTARTNLKSPLREAKPGERVLLRCDLGLNSCGQMFMAPVVLRRIDEERGRISMGGQFVDMPEEAVKLLNEYVDRMQSILGE